MDTFELVAVILGVSALASVFNARVLKLPDTIGLMATGLLASFAFLIFGSLFPDLIVVICHQVAEFDFTSFVFDFALGFLIFAGAFSADASAMQRDRWPILIFATVGILLSTFIVGGLVFGITGLLGLEVPFIHCLLFGALISPTDPIAVLALLKDSSVPRNLQADIAGESLLNDGVAVVVFLTILQIAGGGGTDHSGATESGSSVASVAMLFGREVFGGAILGAVFGWIGVKLLRIAKAPAIDILVSIAAVTGCYALAGQLHVSGALGLVVTGLMFGAALRSKDVDESDRQHLDDFWEAIDHLLNAVLFTLMGLVLLGLSQDFQWNFALAGILAVPAVLLARLISVSLPLPFTKLRCGQLGSTIAILTWGGLRGGISIALALSLNDDLSRNLLVHMTYIVVAFSILGQGLTINPLVKRLMISSE